MILIGDRINSRIVEVKKAIKDRNDSYIRDLVERQADRCDYLDLFTESREDMLWLIEVVQDLIGEDVKLCIDTTDVDILDSALSASEGRTMVNSITGEEKRLSEFLPLIRDHGASCIALCMDDGGIPNTAEDRSAISKKILKRGDNLDIYFDPLVLPISVNDVNGMTALNTLEILKSMDMKTTIGLTNISYGLPNRKLVEGAFLLSSFRYLDSAILNPLDKSLISMLKAGEAIHGMDRYCRNYLRDYR